MASWVKRGMGAAKDKKTCRSAITDQITSVGEYLHLHLRFGF